MSLPTNYRTTLSKHPHIVNVSLGKRSYPIYIGEQLLRAAGALMRKQGIGPAVVIITDQQVHRRYGALLEKYLKKDSYVVRTIVLPSGEQQKSFETANKLYTQLLRWNIERSAAIVAFGGGVIGDLAGFVASTYQRGIGFVQIPTTLLAQVDSSVGGKVGINHPIAKNMIGSFYQPGLVIADTTVLTSLPKREMICGLGEVVKYGMILDKKLFSYLELHLESIFNRDVDSLSHIIQRSCELKAHVVANDEREANLRAILNFGHTIGHALEHAGKYGMLKHGEAVLYGMVAETFIAAARGMISLRDVERLERLIQRLPIPSLEKLKLNNASLIATMTSDKKTINGAIRISLPKRIGNVMLPVPVDLPSLHRALDYVKAYGA